MRLITAFFKADPDHRKHFGSMISSLGNVTAIQPEYRSESLTIQPFNCVPITFNTSSIITHHIWTLYGEFNILVAGADEFYPAQLIDDVGKEVRRWIHAISSESEALGSDDMV